MKGLKSDIILFLSGICAILFLILFISELFLNDYSLPFYVQQIMLIPLTLSFFFGYLYYEGSLGLKPPIWRFTGFFSYMCSIQIIAILNILGILHYIALIGFAYILGIVFGFFTFTITLKSLKIHKSNRLFTNFSIVLLFEISTMIFVVINFSSIFIPYNQFLNYFSIIFIILSSIFFLTNLFFYRKYAFISPNKIFTLLIYNQAGIFVYKTYSTLLEHQDFFKISDVLISAALSAFSLFIEDLLGSNVRFKHIYASLYEILIKQLPKSSATIVLICSKVNYYIKTALDKFAKEIPEKAISEFNHCDGELNKPIGNIVDDLLKKDFPYYTYNKKSVF